MKTAQVAAFSAANSGVSATGTVVGKGISRRARLRRSAFELLRSAMAVPSEAYGEGWRPHGDSNLGDV